MKKKLLVIVAMMLTVATFATLIGTVSAAGEDAADAYLYAYYSDKIVLDGNASQDGSADGVGSMGATTEYDSNAGSGENHFIEYVFDTVSGVKVAATWNDTTDVLYLAVPSTVTKLEVEIGGKALTIDRAALTVTGITGAEVKKGDIYEIAIPLNKTLKLGYDGMYITTDLKVTTDAGTFTGKLAFTSMVPIILAAGDQSYRAKNVAAPDGVKLTTISGAKRYYRHWILKHEINDDNSIMLRAKFTDAEVAALGNGDPRCGAFLYGYDPMYGDIADAETYVLKADLKVVGLPEVDKNQIAGSRDIAGGGLAYDATRPHASIYMANGTNILGKATMYCASIFNTDEGLKMVISTFVGNGEVIDLGVDVDEEFELKLINNVVKTDPKAELAEMKLIDADENNIIEVYVNGKLVGSAKGKSNTGTAISEYGFGFNVISCVQGFKNDNGTKSITGYLWENGGLEVANVVSSYEKEYKIMDLAALSTEEVANVAEANDRFLKGYEPPKPPVDPDPPVDGGTTQTPGGQTPDTPTTDKPADKKDDDAKTDEKKSGCGSSVAGIGLVAVLGTALTAVVATKKKED